MFKLFSRPGKDTNLTAPASGKLISITEVEDDLFSQKMLGDGFAVIPEKGEILSPVSGKVMTVFPTKHAIGITSDQGAEILIHIGIDTVSLEGKGINVSITEGQKIKAGSKIAEVDLSYLQEHEKDNAVIVIVTNMEVIEKIDITKYGAVAAGDVIGTAFHQA